MRLRHLLVATALACLALALVGSAMESTDDSPPRVARDAPPEGFRAFSPDSWWNTPVADDAPLHPFGPEILDHLRTAPGSGPGCLTLAGAGDSPWGHPIYWASPPDPTYELQVPESIDLPELARLRIPRGARPAANSDGSMTVYDREQGFVVALTDAAYDAGDDSWSADGATVTYLESNGLRVETGRSDDPRNRGTHRGNNGATMAAAWEDVEDGEIRHVLKIAVGPEMSRDHVFPMVGSDGDYAGDDPAVPPQGVRLRIKPSVDLDAVDLHPEARVIAEALQRYGAYIGDSGGTTALKLEDTATEGRGQLWDVSADALCDLPFSPTHWDVMAVDETSVDETDPS
ncbi:MAG: hypothetical protein AVDCRST_MAG32-1541 [uncultured Nocardioides sp.]|uniref:Uncharacterized protein n=1 Tax=uncultured Nocardioides sp. TaxID=198441 RepID=A0A6J4N7A2_9ACTN|nr:MAG: hypothetical protein AVDCRST_MAG32-1541 [uncultured Nocardioides sp.]